MNLSKFIAPENESSVLKNIPIKNLKEVQKEIRTITRVITVYSSICEIKPTYKFRGPRNKYAFSTTKANAKTASVYLRIIPTCPGLSTKTINEIHSHVKKNFQYCIK